MRRRAAWTAALWNHPRMTSAQPDEQQLTVSRVVGAPPERVFAMLADPDRHRDFDGSGMLRVSRTHIAMTDLGEVFTMEMRQKSLGDYEIENHVVVYERDVALGWAPAAPGEEPTGHTWTYRLAPEGSGDGGTRVTLTYDWSGITDESLRQYLPVVTREQLDRSLELLDDVLR